MTRTLTALPLTLCLLVTSGTAFGSTGGSPPLPADSTRLDVASVPRDGVVAGNSECGPCNVVEEVSITTAAGTPVEGVVTDLSDLRAVGTWAFTPSSPWVPGEYLAQYGNGDPVPFTVLDEVISPPTVTPTLSSPITERRDEIQCVSKAPTAENPEGELEWLSLTGWTEGLFHVAASGSSSDQYTYLVGVNGEVRFSSYGAGAYFEIMPGTSPICYWVRAQRLVSREETLLVDECYSPEELDQYVRQDASAEELQTFLRDKCILPPAGFVTEWCSSFQSAIDEGACHASEFANVKACESALELCAGGDTSSMPPGSDPGSNPDSNDDSGDSGGGCAISPTSAGSVQGAGALLAILASLATRRRRRAQQEATRSSYHRVGD